MTELLPLRDEVVLVSPASEFLAQAPLFARFEWSENNGVYALVHSGKSTSRLHQIRVDDPRSEGSISFPVAIGKEVSPDNFVKYGQIRVVHPSVQDFRRLSAEGLIAQLPILEVLKGRCHGFELGLAYHIERPSVNGSVEKVLVNDVSLYSRRQ